MNPIYRFELTKNGADARPAFPVYRDDLTIDYALQQGEEFYRGTLSGKLTFQSVDFDYINTAAFDTRFGLVIYISYDGGHTWAAYWHGKFYKTDCDFNDDDKTAIVTPELDDSYNDVLAGLEKEYDLIKLTPEIGKVRYDKRPMLQYYVAGSNVVGCFLSGMWWEQECGSPESATDIYNAGFAQIVNRVTGAFTQTTGALPQLPSFMSFDPTFPFPESWSMSGGGYVFDCTRLGTNNYRFLIYPSGQPNNWLWVGFGDTNTPIPAFTVHLSPASGSPATGNVDVTIDLFQVWARIITDKETEDAVRITADDFVPDIRNYRYAVRAGEDLVDSVAFTAELSNTPTEWGLYQPGKYYVTPVGLSPQDCLPLCRSLWGSFSLWVHRSEIPDEIDPTYRAQSVLRDAYPIASVISVLLGQFAPNITHQGTTDYSLFLYGNSDPLTFVSHHLFITPKSNVLTAGYDQPAQTAKITLRAVLDMLRDCFRCYWFIDGSNRFRIEHIEFFRRGGSYSLNPQPRIDLTQQKVSRNGKSWAYARNQYKFDKPEMAERYQFGWMDDVTAQFEGQPIDIVSGYVQPGNIETIKPSQFTADVDYMLLNPGACSKDGFALLSALPTRVAYDLDSFEMLDRWINTSTGNWGTNTVYKHITIPIVPGQRVRVVANSSTAAQIAWLTSDIVGGSGEAAPLVTDTSVITQAANTTEEYTAPAGAAFLYVYFGQGTAYAPKPASVSLYDGFTLPYVNISGYILQNGQMCWPYLQIYYVWDMPARIYKIGATQYTATGVKKLKTQSLKFPVLQEPNFYELVKTELGNGTIQKMSVNLSSRNANATLKYDYDTE